MIKNTLMAIAAILALAGCRKFTEPAIENLRQFDESAYIPSDARFPFGLLLNGYNRIPTNSWSFNDVATDDAVTNDQNNAFLKMATGQWSAINNPVSQWTNSFAAIHYLNLMLVKADTVKWAAEETVNALFNRRIKGEAYGLRALFLYHLLQTHAGVSQSGQLLGVPIILEPQATDANFNIARASFAECMQQIYADLNRAEDMLPLDYENLPTGAQVPAKFGPITVQQYNRVYGMAFRGLLTARIAKAIKAQAALLAASPAYAGGSTTTWEHAANFAGEVLNLKGGLSALAPNGLTWYSNASEISGLADGANPPEILWRSNYVDNRALEQENYPPTLFGNGRINPSENLVQSFPMENGYPISDPASGYNSAAPYNNRDPRLRMFVLVNGGTAGPSNTVINTAVDGPTFDALNRVETSTRTGYYLRKLLRQDVNLNPQSANNQRHYKPHIRYTEMFLIYAEAANEAWGPMGSGNHGFSAYDVIRAIRRRAGVGTSNGDPYLEAAKGSKEAMRALIRNERRLELCFEGFRFWDLRRWKENLNDNVKGVSIRNGIYSIIPVEDRVYQSHMIYGPIPLIEILKFGALQQNRGWQ